MQHFLVFSLFIYSSHTWVLETSHNQVTFGSTKYVSLECKYDNQDNREPRIVQVSRMVIHKFNGSDHWQTFAQVRDNNINAFQSDGVGPGVSVKGHADTASNSFLSMTWSVASPNLSGRYACEINGFASDDEVVEVITTPVSINGSELSLESLLSMVLDVKEENQILRKQATQDFGRLQKFFLTLKEQADKDRNQSTHNFGGVQQFIESLKEQADEDRKQSTQNCVRVQQLIETLKEQADKDRNQSAQMFGRMEQLIQAVSDNFDNFKNFTKQIMNRYMTREEKNSTLDPKKQDLHEKVSWPSGQYALFQTESGCPNSVTKNWTAGYIKFTSESSNGKKNSNSVSQPSHLAKPVFVKTGQYNYVYMRTCKPTANTTQQAWPKGSYCIHRVGGVCPMGFESARLGLDAENDHNVVEHHNGPDGKDGAGYFYFCCRRDGLPTTPISLPTDTPFYLNRYTGTCQKVQSAKVTEEWLEIDTEDTNNIDSQEPTTSPDVTLNPVRFFLCYYTKIQ